jgi:SAM-dependent methyltransferase
MRSVTLEQLIRILRFCYYGQFRLLWYRAWIRLKGLDLGGVSAEELGHSAALAAHQESGGPILETVLKQVAIPVNSRIIDFGSGKGGAAFTLAKFPFAEIVGVEISPQLVAIAGENARRLQLDSRVQFVCSDATEYMDLDRFTHGYIFNSFAPELVQRTCSNVLESLERRPRTFTLICKYPEGCVQEFFPASPRLRLQAKIESRFSHPFYVFSIT